MSQWQLACTLSKQLQPLISPHCLFWECKNAWSQIITLLLAHSWEEWCWERMTQNVWYDSDDGNVWSPCSLVWCHIYGKNQISICTTKPTLVFSSPVIYLYLKKKILFYIEKLSTRIWHFAVNMILIALLGRLWGFSVIQCLSWVKDFGADFFSVDKKHNPEILFFSISFLDESHVYMTQRLHAFRLRSR